MTAAAGLQCGFGEFLGAEVYDSMKALGFTIARLDLQEQSQDRTAQLAQEAIDHGIQPLCILRRVEQLSVLPVGALAEAGNEPDIKKFGWSKASYRAFAMEFWPEALRRGIRCYIGVYSSFRDRTDWRRDLPWRDIPAEVGCAMHWYPGAPDNRRQLHPTDDEVASLRRDVGARPLCISEIGYHDGPDGWPEPQVADHMAHARRFYSQHGFDFVVAFQMNDGPPTARDPEAHFGFRRYNSTEWKPVATAFAGAIE